MKSLSLFLFLPFLTCGLLLGNAVFTELVYESSKTYSKGDAVIPSSTEFTLYTAKTSVPADASGQNAPPNTTYWQTAEEYSSELQNTYSGTVSSPPSSDNINTSEIINLGTPDTITGGEAPSFTENDILIENTSTGERASWKIYGAKWQFQTEEVLLSGGATIGTYSSTTVVFGSGDFDNDGNIDVILNDTATGVTKIVFMNGNSESSQVTVGTLSTSDTAVALADFNSDGLFDIVTQNETSGVKTIHYLSGSGRSLSIGSSSPVTTDPAYTIAGAGDFDQDGNVDLLVEQVSSDSDPLTKVARIIWLMNGSSITSTTEVLGPFQQEWRMKGTGDFDNDSNLDIMVEQDGTGRKGIWYLNKTKIRDGFTYLTLQPEWLTGCSGDFNKDGSNDPVFFNKSTGKVMILNLANQSSSDNQFGNKYAFLNINRNFISSGNTNAGKDWKMRGFIDYDGDSKLEILADNMSTGEKAIWQISANNVVSSTVFATKSDWRMCGTGEFGGDSTSDIVAENISSGQKEIWIMSYSNGTFSISSTNNFATDVTKRIVGAGDFNGDNIPDLVVEGLTTNSDYAAEVPRQIWYMNGTTKSSEYTFLDFKQEWRMRGVLDYDSNGYPDIVVEQDNMGRKGIWAMKDNGSNSVLLEYGFTFTTVGPLWSFSIQ